MNKRLAHIVFFGLALLLLAGINACNRGCDDDNIVDRYQRIDTEQVHKFAYDGSETLTFLEIDNGDSTILVFENEEAFDDLEESADYYEADNGDLCVGYRYFTEIKYMKYYCAERDWHFIAGMNGVNDEITLQFDEQFDTDSKYNFDIDLTAFALDDPEYLGWGGNHYLGEYPSLNGQNSNTTKILIINDESLFYDTVNGLLSWEFEEKEYYLKLLKTDK